VALFLVLNWTAAAPWGGVDTSFDTGGRNGGFDAEVTALGLQPDGKILAAGVFTQLNSADRLGLARLNPNGSLDPSLDPGAGVDRLVEALVLQPDGRLLLGGWSSTYDGAAVPYLARVEPGGSLSPGFVPSPGDYLTDCHIQPDGRILVSGYFTSIGGLVRAYVARLHPDGTVDTSFNVAPDHYVYTVALQPDGRILIAGNFTSVDGSPRNRVARVLPDGTLDPSFEPGLGADRIIYDLELQPDGKVVLGGWFTELHGREQWFLGRLTETGTLDDTFNPQIDPAFGQVLSVKAQPNGKILAAGQFWSVGAVDRPCIARFHADGSLDTDFDPGTGPVEDPKTGLQPMIREIALQADGCVLACGRFIEFDGTRVNRLVRLTGDNGGSAQWGQSAASVGENESQVQLALSRTGSSAGPVSVDIGVWSSGGAAEGVDFVLDRSTVVFGEGEMSAAITLSVPAGGMTNDDAEVLLGLGNPLGGLVLGSTQLLPVTIAARSGGEIVPPQFVAITPQPPETLRISVATQTPGDYVLQASGDFQQWTVVQTLPGPGTLEFDVQRQSAGHQQFYRVLR
jgi:uncharacterized delta-60 repeat protein